jgi:membrane-bound ClpP family serine protease
VFGDEHVDVVEWSGEEGYVRAGGELWRARSDAALAPGDRVKVVRMDGLMLDGSKK